MILTPRQLEVARLFALGRTWEEIVFELGITRHTVAEHRRDAIARAGGGSLVDVWRGLGWLTVPPGAPSGKRSAGLASAPPPRPWR